jgi:hypothetical protein
MLTASLKTTKNLLVASFYYKELKNLLKKNTFWLNHNGKSQITETIASSVV